MPTFEVRFQQTKILRFPKSAQIGEVRFGERAGGVTSAAVVSLQGHHGHGIDFAHYIGMKIKSTKELRTEHGEIGRANIAAFIRGVT